MFSKFNHPAKPAALSAGEPLELTQVELDGALAAAEPDQEIKVMQNLWFCATFHGLSHDQKGKPFYRMDRNLGIAQAYDDGGALIRMPLILRNRGSETSPQWREQKTVPFLFCGKLPAHIAKEVFDAILASGVNPEHRVQIQVCVTIYATPHDFAKAKPGNYQGKAYRSVNVRLAVNKPVVVAFAGDKEWVSHLGDLVADIQEDASTGVIDPLRYLEAVLDAQAIQEADAISRKNRAARQRKEEAKQAADSAKRQAETPIDIDDEDIVGA